MTISSTRLRSAFLVFALFLLMAAGLAGVTPFAVYAQDGDQAGPEEPVGKAYRGETLFVQRCVQCHGETGKGDGPLAEQIPDPIPDFTAPDYAAEMSPQDIFDVITEGRMDKMMPPWGGQLSEEERWDLTAYV